MTHTLQTSKCPTCNREFRDSHALGQHTRAKGHGQFKLLTDDDGPSMSSLMIDAQIDRAMGLPVDDWLVDMLPD